MGDFIGLDIGGTKILGALYDAGGTLRAREKKKSKAHLGCDVVLERIEDVLDTLVNQSKGPIEGIGVGVPGLVDREGSVVFSPNLPFRNLALSQRLSARYGVPVSVGNDVNVALYGEWAHMKDPELKHVVGVFVGTGVGGAMILDGRLYVGREGAGELGHMVVHADGAYCGCGNRGCLEAYASKTAMHQYIRAQAARGRASVLSDADSGIVKSSELRAAYDAQDAVVTEAVERARMYLGVAAGTLISIFHPQMLVLGGGIMDAFGDVMIPEIERRALAQTMPGMGPGTVFQRASLGDDVGIYGAFAQIRERVYERTR